MKRDFLKGLGIGDEMINMIMAENGKDIEAAKGELETLKQNASAKDTEIEGLKGQITQRDSDIESLKKSVADNAALQTQLTELQTKYTTDTTALQDKLNQQKVDFDTQKATDKFFADVNFSSDLAREAAISQFKAKQFKLDGETFLGGKEWLEELKKSSPDAFKAAESEYQPTFTKPMQHAQNQGGQQPNNNTQFGGWAFTQVRAFDKK